MRTTAVYRSPLFLAHYTGRDHLESAVRLEALYEELNRPEVASRYVFPEFKPATPAQIRLNHSPALVASVAATAGRPAVFLDADTRTSADSYQAALLAAGSVIDGIRRLASGEIDNGFCLVRPPGHHAEQDRAGGFCLFNSIAVAAKWALRNTGVDRILIIDWDLHHGNGTQNSFYSSDRVLYCSCHQYPLYPGSGTLMETGRGRGRGYTVNVPLAGGHGDGQYIRLFKEIFAPLARIFRPGLILVSCGFDIMSGDPIGAMQVSPAGIAALTGILVALAEQFCDGRLLFVLEGGYVPENIRSGTLAVLAELQGTPLFGEEELARLHLSDARSASIDQAAALFSTTRQ